MIISALPEGDLFAGTKTIPSGDQYFTSFAGVAWTGGREYLRGYVFVGEGSSDEMCLGVIAATK